MKKTPISERALIARINRKLDKEYNVLRKTRPGLRNYSNLGEYYVLHYYTNTIVNTHVDIEQLGKDLKCMHENEKLITE